MARPDVQRDVEIGLSLGLTPSAFDAVGAEDRGLLQANWSAKRRVCPQHGGDISECSHDVWFPQRTVCIPAMELAGANARYDQIHEAKPYHDGTFKKWGKDRTRLTPYHYRDGVTIWVSRQDVNPDDKFL